MQQDRKGTRSRSARLASRMIAAAILGVVSAAGMPLGEIHAQECSPRKTCSKIHSCEEARWYLENCSWGGRLDRDNDGSPCENLCGDGD